MDIKEAEIDTRDLEKDLERVDELQLNNGEIVNVSGHQQELDRQFSLFSIVSVGVVTGSVWPALAGKWTTRPW